MAKRKRNYKVEYKRRVARALARGLSRSQGRGHPKVSKTKKVKKARDALEDSKLQAGLRFFFKKKNVSKAAKEAHISTERLRSFVIDKGIAEKRGQRWVVKQHPLRRVLIYTNGKEEPVEVTQRTASLVGKYMAGVRWFVTTNDPTHLAPFIGKSIRDASGERYPLETDPNVLYRVSHTGTASFEQIYRVVI